MMQFKCDYCGRTFSEPSVKTYMENLDGENGWQRCVDSFCPFCGCETFEPLPNADDDDDLYAPEPDWVRERREWEEDHD